MNYFIYGLIDPRNSLIYYIGKTVNLKRRFDQHLRDKSKSKKNSWIKSLKKLGLLPKMEIIEITKKEMVDQREIYWIDFWKSKNLNLKNMTKGGTGGNIGPNRVRAVKNSLGEAFGSIKEASKKHKIHPGRIVQCCKGVTLSSKGICWAYAENELIIREKRKHINTVYCNNGKIYNTLSEAAKELKLCKSSISDCVNNRITNHKGYKFWYPGNTPKEKLKTGKIIKCITNGQIYPSAREASRILKLCPKQICNHLKGKQSEVHGFVFKYLKDK